MTVALVVMETPAIIFAIVLARCYQPGGIGNGSLGRTFAGALTDGTILLLVGSLFIGYFLTATGSADSPLSAFISGDMFTGMLIFFLLYMGTKVGRKIRELESFPLRRKCAWRLVLSGMSLDRFLKPRPLNWPGCRGRSFWTCSAEWAPLRCKQTHPSLPPRSNKA